MDRICWDYILKNHTAIDARNFAITYSEIHPLTEILKKNNTLTDLDLSHNKIRDLGAQYLSECLKENRTLTSLYIRYNEIGDRGAEALYNSLKKNTTLTLLGICHNDISDRLIKKIEREITENISGRKKQRYNCGTILLLLKDIEEKSLFHKDSFPLDLFKIIWKLSDVF